MSNAPDNLFDTRYFAIGVVRSDPREAMIDAAELAAHMIRSFAADFTGDEMIIDPLPFMNAAERHSARLTTGDTLHLFVLPWPAPIALPDGWLGLFVASTRRWKRGQIALIEALDAFVDDFVQRHWPLEQLAIGRRPHTQPHLYFSYQVFVAQLDDAATP